MDLYRKLPEPAIQLLDTTIEALAKSRYPLCRACPLNYLGVCGACDFPLNELLTNPAVGCPEEHWDPFVSAKGGLLPSGVRILRHSPSTRTPFALQHPGSRRTRVTEEAQVWGDLGARHLIYHIYPVATNSHWRWNVEQLLKRIDLFDGVRSVAILKPGTSHGKVRGTAGRGEAAKLDSVAAVKAAFDGHRIDNWIIAPNNPKKREVVTRDALFETLPFRGVTFSAHAKGVTFDTKSATVSQWTDMMYQTCLDCWPLVESQLQTKYTAGSFQVEARFGMSRWHYSGSFYWFRNEQRLLESPCPPGWFGTEEWPGVTVPLSAAGCLFGKSVGGGGELYKPEIHTRLPDMLKKWKKNNAKNFGDRAAQSAAQ